MNYKKAVTLLTACASAVSAIYSNGSAAADTTTLAPSYSVSPVATSTYAYTDDTTTFFVTSTLYETISLLASGASSFADVAPVVTDIVSVNEKDVTTTITSTLFTTLTQVQGNDTVSASSNDSNCAPVTVTVTAQPTEYATVTVANTTVTVTASAGFGSAQVRWSNSTMAN